jgi:hypothetical protein
MTVLRTHWSYLPVFQRRPDGTIWRLRSFRWNQRRIELEWATDTAPAQGQTPIIDDWITNVSPFGLAGPPDVMSPPPTSAAPPTGVWSNTAPTPAAATATGAAPPPPDAAGEDDAPAEPPTHRRRTA